MQLKVAEAISGLIFPPKVSSQSLGQGFRAPSITFGQLGGGLFSGWRLFVRLRSGVIARCWCLAVWRQGHLDIQHLVAWLGATRAAWRRLPRQADRLSQEVGGRLGLAWRASEAPVTQQYGDAGAVALRIVPKEPGLGAI